MSIAMTVLRTLDHTGPIIAESLFELIEERYFIPIKDIKQAKNYLVSKCWITKTSEISLTESGRARLERSKSDTPEVDEFTTQINHMKRSVRPKVTNVKADDIYPILTALNDNAPLNFAELDYETGPKKDRSRLQAGIAMARQKCLITKTRHHRFALTRIGHAMINESTQPNQ